MTSFTVIIQIYNLPLSLLVTPIASLPFCFRIRTFGEKSSAMIIKRLPDHSWAGEMVTMKYFTKANIKRLGKLIEAKHQELFAFDKQ